jgi:hypothetical protein
MDTSNTFIPTLVSYLGLFPTLLVWLTGFILASVYWRRHPRVSLLTVISLAIFLVEALVSTYLNLWLPLILSEHSIETTQIGLIFAIKGIVTSIILAVAWGMLVAAIFGERKAVPIDKNSIAQESPIIESSIEEDKSPKSRKKHDWAKIGGTAGGVMSLLLLFILPVWRGGAIVVILYTFVCTGIGVVIGIGIERRLLTLQRSSPTEQRIAP